MATRRAPPGSPDAPRPEPAGGAPGPESPRRAPVGRPGAISQDYFGSATFDADDFDDPAGSALRLDTHDDGQPGLAQAADGGALDPGDLDDDFARGSAAAAQIPQPQMAKAPRRRAWPTGQAPDSGAIRIDGVEVTLLADFGPKPTSMVGAPAYALRVARRKRVLTAKLKEQAAALSEAEYERDCLVVAMVRDLRGSILMVEEGQKLFEPVLAIERTALERRSALAGANAEYDRRSRDLDEQKAAVERDASARQAAVDQRGAALAEQRRLLERAEAKKKRLFIEIRAIVEAAEKNPETMTAAQGARLAELEAQVAQHKPELEAAARTVEAAQAQLSSAEEEARQATRKVREAERVRRALDQEFQKEIGVRSHGVSEVDRQRLDAFVAVGCAVLAARGKLVDVADDTLDSIIRAEAVVLDRMTVLEKTARALDAYDKGLFKQGVALAAAAAAALIVALIVLVTR